VGQSVPNILKMSKMLSPYQISMTYLNGHSSTCPCSDAEALAQESVACLTAVVLTEEVAKEEENEQNGVSPATGGMNDIL